MSRPPFRTERERMGHPDLFHRQEGWATRPSVVIVLPTGIPGPGTSGICAVDDNAASTTAAITTAFTHIRMVLLLRALLVEAEVWTVGSKRIDESSANVATATARTSQTAGADLRGRASYRGRQFLNNLRWQDHLLTIGRQC